MNSAVPNSYRALHRALLANAAFSLLTGGAQLLLARSLAPLLGLAPNTAVLPLIGAGLATFAGGVLWLATRPRPDRLLSLLVSFADLLWVLGSVLLMVLARGQLPLAGQLLVGSTAGVVLAFALLQLRGITRSFRAALGSREIRVCVEVATPTTADTLWRNIAQIGRIADFMPSLASSSLRGEAVPGLGAIRDCTDQGGRSWSERCTHWEPARREFDVVFLTDAPRFPFPFSHLRGGWQVSPTVTGSTVRVWWQGELRRPILTALILPVMEWQARRDFGGVVQRLAETNPVRREFRRW